MARMECRLIFYAYWKRFGPQIAWLFNWIYRIHGGFTIPKNQSSLDATFDDRPTKINRTIDIRKYANASIETKTFARIELTRCWKFNYNRSKQFQLTCAICFCSSNDGKISSQVHISQIRIAVFTSSACPQVTYISMLSIVTMCYLFKSEANVSPLMCMVLVELLSCGCASRLNDWFV